jgi:uncharacterized membrane protein
MINVIRRIAGNIRFGGTRGDVLVPNQEELHRKARQKVIQAVESRLKERRTTGERFADWLVSLFGTLTSASIHLVAFTAWIVINLGWIEGVSVFDPYPFTLLTMTVSLEAIFLAIFVLLSQNRESKISTLREEIDIYVNMISEQEVTKVIHLVSHLMKHLNVPFEDDPELSQMMKPLDTAKIEEELERQLNISIKKL